MTSPLPKISLQARIGASADIALRLETGELRFKAISGMQKTAPLRVTSTSHGIPDGWHVAIVDAKGMTDRNAADPNKLRDSDFSEISVIDADTVDFLGVSAANFHTYTSGGYLAFYVPLVLSGYTSGKMDIKEKVGGAVKLALSTTAGTLEISDPTSTVWIRLGEADIAALSAREYVFDIELISSTAIDAICSAESMFEVLPEVTTS